jgi:hypothetical protein
MSNSYYTPKELAPLVASVAIAMAANAAVRSVGKAADLVATICTANARAWNVGLHASHSDRKDAVLASDLAREARPYLLGTRHGEIAREGLRMMNFLHRNCGHLTEIEASAMLGVYSLVARVALDAMEPS